MRHLSLAAWIAALFLPCAVALADLVTYHVSVPEPSTQTLRVSMTITGIPPEQKSVEFHLPVWRPGLYMILDQAGTVRDVRAAGGLAGEQRPLRVGKYEKSSWRVGTEGCPTVTIDYAVWAASLENRTRHVDDTHAFMSPSAVFMYVHERRNSPLEVRLDLPQNWTVATGLQTTRVSDELPGNSIWLLHAPNYDVLVDSPIEAGIHDVLRFDAAGASHEFVLWTGEPNLDAKAPISIRGTENYNKLPADFAKLVEAHKNVFGKLPYQRYVFIGHCYPGGRGGTEHLNSTVIQFPPTVFRDKEGYDRLLRLSSHEIFHTWNVKAFRPAGLVPYEYQRENYTDLLWLAEGTTSYYEDVLLVRAGLMKPEDYFKIISKSVDAHQKLPGAKVQSVSDSSFDAWVKHSKKTANDVNTNVSFYDRGAMVSLLMDMTIRARTRGEKSMDDLLRRLYAEFPDASRGYTTADVKRLLADLLGGPEESERFFAEYIEGTREIDFAGALATVGLKLEREKKSKPADDKPAPGTPPDDSSLAMPGEDHGEKHDEKPYAGINVADSGGLVQVSAVLSDGPGVAAGLIPGDLIVALDGTRITAGGWDKALEYREPGDSVRLAFFRNDMLRETSLTLAARPAGDLKATRDPDAGGDARRAYTSWLGQPWPEKKSGEKSEKSEK